MPAESPTRMMSMPARSTRRANAAPSPSSHIATRPSGNHAPADTRDAARARAERERRETRGRAGGGDDTKNGEAPEPPDDTAHNTGTTNQTHKPQQASGGG